MRVRERERERRERRKMAERGGDGRASARIRRWQLGARRWQYSGVYVSKNFLVVLLLPSATRDKWAPLDILVVSPGLGSTCQVVLGSCGVQASQLTCLAHSMGGLLSLMAAAGDRGMFQRLVVCSPMLRMKVQCFAGGC